LYKVLWLKPVFFTLKMNEDNLILVMYVPLAVIGKEYQHLVIGQKSFFTKFLP